MPTLIITDEFLAAEQRPGYYIPHVFRDERHFKAWCQVYQPTLMVRPSFARGRCKRAIDHRHENDTAVEAVLDAQADEATLDAPRAGLGAAR